MYDLNLPLRYYWKCPGCYLEFIFEYNGVCSCGEILELKKEKSEFPEGRYEKSRVPDDWMV